MSGNSARKEAQSLPNSNTTFQQKGADLVDDAGALAHQPLPYAVQPCRSSWSAVLVATNFIVGRCTASAMASASRKSFFCPVPSNRAGRTAPASAGHRGRASGACG
jgi:hypothetical protein